MMHTGENKKPRVLGIVGATASGKTALSLNIAESLGCEILCMDSMQVYKRMDIGTAKPTAAEQARVPHHLLDLVEPADSFSVAEYVSAAHAVIQQILSRGRIPLLVGGTGLYLQGLSLPLDYGGLPSNPAIRAELQQQLDQDGADAMHAKLSAIDPQSAARLHPNDTRRVIRALEIYRLTGVPMSGHRVPSAADSPYDFQLYAIDWPRPELHRRINLRVDQMMQEGLLNEVKGLLRSGITAEMQSMQGLGYKELIPVIQQNASLDNAIEQIKTGTRNYARRQLIWFRRDKRIRWIAAEQLSCAKEMIINNWEDPAAWISTL